ncbi:DUF4421 domain-containing protein [Hyphobacterium sp. CCMP332]|nr:DUF4421 domain-containing protein [Hyphobacterium sp. CCMP332]
MNNRLIRTLLIIYYCTFCHFLSWADTESTETDSSYVASFYNHLNWRYYLSQKYTSLRLANVSENYELNYIPNTSLNMGIGATYKWATLNLAYGFRFLNGDQDKGRTRWLDLQAHQYFRKITIDVLGQFYSGFYLSPAGKAVKVGKQYYNRPDLNVIQVGASVQYIFNHQRFSYRALFFQNEWQKKSAGSPLAGFEVFVVNINADSSIVPSLISRAESDLNTNLLRSFQFGPNFGYAHTLVFKKHFYLSLSGSVSLGFGTNSFLDLGNNARINFTPNFFVRAFAGYNSRKWAIGLTGINNGQSLAKASGNERVTIYSGNFRINFVYRVLPNRSTKRVLKPIDDFDFD